MKKVLVSGYIGFGNFGDEAIFKVLKEHLKELKFDVSALSYADRYDIKTYKYKSPFDILKAILNCDILISGGGSLLQNKTSNSSLIYYLMIILFAKLFFKKVIIFAQGFEPVKGKIYKNITKNVLKLCDFISVRDEKSQKLLKDSGINSYLVYDPVYYLTSSMEQKKDKNGVLVQLREVKNMDKTLISDLAGEIIKYSKKITVLALQNEYDETICKEFVNEFKRLGADADYIYNENTDKTIELINSCKYVISMRLHGLIVSASLKSIAFALSYDEKVNTLVSDLGIPYINIYKYTKDELSEKIEKFFNTENASYKCPKFRWDIIDKELLQGE